MATTPTTDDLRARVAEVLPGIRRDLEDLVRIESVSADPERAGEVRRSAEAVRTLLEAEGCTARITSADGGAPAVIAHKQGPDGAPTVLLYAHHDVQPENDHADWDSAPFEPTERGDRLYGRGAADDKAGIAAHLAALRIFGDDLPVNVVFFIEGEEEVGSETLPALLKENLDDLARRRHRHRRLRQLGHRRARPHHQPEGPGPDGRRGPHPHPRRALRHVGRARARLADDARPADHAPSTTTAATSRSTACTPARPRTSSTPRSGCAPSPAPWPASTGSARARPSSGSGPSPRSRITGLDGPKVAGASNTLVPAASCRISMRIAPGDTTANAVERLTEHLEKNIAWGAELTMTVVDTGEATQIDATGPAYDAARSAFADAWDGTEPVDMGVGGSIPFIAEFLEAFPEASVLVTGVEDPDTRAHGANEGLHLAEFEKVLLAEALLLRNLG